jgi:hypothetical protein
VASSQWWRATTVIQINTINLAWKGKLAGWKRKVVREKVRIQVERRAFGKSREKEMRTWKMLGAD